MEKLYTLTAHELRDKLASKEVSAKEIAQSFIDRINSVEDKVKAFVTTTPEAALAKAEEIDAKIAAGETLPPLAGIPWAIKDNMSTKGVLTT